MFNHQMVRIGHVDRLLCILAATKRMVGVLQTAMHECAGDHKPADDAEACYCITPVLGRLGRLQAGLCHPVAAHKPWYALDSDDTFLGRILPHVTHNCSTHCFDGNGSLIPSLDGLTGEGGQPEHANGAVSLPPLDPRPELKRKVMLEAMQLIAQDVDRDAKAAAATQAKKIATIQQMMPGIKLLDDAPAGGGAAGGADPGAMSRTASAKKRAVAHGLVEHGTFPREPEPQPEELLEGDTGPSRRAGGR